MIGDLLNNHLAISVAVALLVVKALIWIAALGSGTSGGVLAPLLMLGAGLGTVLAPWLPGGSPQLWALVCMAGVLGSVLGAPLTAIVFAFGLTHNTEALLPLLLTTAVAYGFSVLTMKRSIMTEKIARRGLHIYREYSVDPLERAHVAELMTRDVITIEADLSVAEATARYFGEHAAHRAYPVVSDGRVLGMLDRATVRAPRRDRHRPACAAATCWWHKPRCWCGPDRTRGGGQHGRVERGAAAVVESLDTMRLVGIVSLRDLLRPSGQVFHEEFRRERLRGSQLAS